MIKIVKMSRTTNSEGNAKSVEVMGGSDWLSHQHDRKKDDQSFA
jgi:hypothetical protein